MSRSALKHHRPPAVLASSLDSYDSLILGEGPVAYVPLSGGTGGALDRTVNGHNVGLQGSPSTGTFLNGSGCTVFNGTSAQYGIIPDHNALSVPTTGILALEYWLRPDILDFTITEGTGPYVYHMGKLQNSHDEYAGRMYNFTTDTDPPRTNRISGYCFNPAAIPPATKNLGAGSYFQDPVTAGNWIHYTLVMNTVDVSASFPTGYTKVYKNGILRDQDALSGYNVVPVNGPANLFLATGDGINSFFQGALAKFTVWDFEPSNATLLNHYRTIVPYVGGSIQFLSHVGDVVDQTSGQFTNLVVGPSGVAAGSTVISKFSHSYTSGAATAVDSRGNAHTVRKSVANSGLTMRESVFTGRIDTPLIEGDVIQFKTSVSTTVREVSSDEFTGISFAAPLDQSNTGQGTSTTPGASTLITTTVADSLLYGQNLINGPLSETYTENIPYTSLTRIGTTAAAIDLTTNSAYQSVTSIQTGAKYAPTSSPAENWVTIMANFAAGAHVPSPPPAGTGEFIGLVASGASSASASTLTLTITGDGATIGSTLFMVTNSSFIGSSPTATDSAGNVWTRDRTAADGGSNLRVAIFSCPVTASLVSGVSTLTVDFHGTLATREAVVGAFSGILVPTTIDKQNGTSGNGTSPSVSTGTTTNANDLIIFGLGVSGPTTDTYSADVIHQWTGLPRVGTNTGTNDKTINWSYRPVGATGNYTAAPTITTNPYVGLIVAYQAT